MTNEAYLIIDTAYLHGAVMLISGTEIVYQEILTTPFTHGRDLAFKVHEAVNLAIKKGLVLKALCCGLGPGSFIGVRIALALSLGFTLATNIALMGFSSHQALAYSVADHEENIIIAMKASLNQFYVNEYDHSGLSCAPTKVLTIDDLSKLNNNYIVYSDKCDDLLGYNKHMIVKEILGPNERGFKRILLSTIKDGIVDQSLGIKPDYIKAPSVFSQTSTG